MSEVTMWSSRWTCVIKPAYSLSFLLSINIFVWQNVLYFLDAPRILTRYETLRTHSLLNNCNIPNVHKYLNIITGSVSGDWVTVIGPKFVFVLQPSRIPLQKNSNTKTFVNIPADTHAHGFQFRTVWRVRYTELHAMINCVAWRVTPG